MELIKEEVECLTESGYYSGKNDIFKDAFRALPGMKPELRFAVAINLYRKGKASLNRVAGIGGVTPQEMKEILVSRGVKIRRGVSEPCKRKKMARELFSIRKK